MTTHQEKIMAKRLNTVKGFVPSPKTGFKWRMLAAKQAAERGTLPTVNRFPDRARGGGCPKCDRMFKTGSGRANHIANYHAA